MIQEGHWRSIGFCKEGSDTVFQEVIGSFGSFSIEIYPILTLYMP